MRAKISKCCALLTRMRPLRIHFGIWRDFSCRTALALRDNRITQLSAVVHKQKLDMDKALAAKQRSAFDLHSAKSASATAAHAAQQEINTLQSEMKRLEKEAEAEKAVISKAYNARFNSHVEELRRSAAKCHRS